LFNFLVDAIDVLRPAHHLGLDIGLLELAPQCLATLGNERLPFGAARRQQAADIPVLQRFQLPESQVFEDITPRIADLDGNGSNEIIAIRASREGGAAVALYGLVEGSLREVGAGSENGRPNRWLNIAGLIPRPDGGLTLYGVRTPHIGGRLFSLDYGAGAVSERNEIELDLTNHVIGSRELGLSVAGEFDGRFELTIPSQDRQRLRFPLSGRPDIILPAPVDKAIALVDGAIVTATGRGELLVIRP
ncbi:MAG: hypothetical protein U1A06_06595, partial [Hoeflea sp.]|nr:hypothetical protein [Hoeflea sp.]